MTVTSVTPKCASALMDLCARYQMPKSRFLSLLPRNKLVDILDRIMKVLKGRKFCNIAKFGFSNTEKLYYILTFSLYIEI